MILCIGALSAGADGADPQASLRELRAQVARLTKELAASEASRADASDALRESEQAISDSSRRLFELQTEQDAARIRIRELETRQLRLSDEVAAQQDTLAGLLYGIYTRGRTEAVSVLLAPADPNQTARRLRYLGYVYRDRAGAIEQLHRDQVQVQALMEAGRHQAEVLAALQAEQTSQQQSLLRQRSARAAALARVSSQIERQRREMGALKRSEERLSRLVQKLAKELAARTPAKKRAPASDGSAAQLPLPRPGAPLAAPVKGELAARFGSPRTDSGLRWNGWFIAAAQGTPVKALAAGRVVFADWLRGFGNLLILDHGDGLMSLYGNNDALLKGVGDEVQAGEQVAAVGSSGGNAESGLYFELRLRGKPVDPARWLGAR
ncbi:MAG: peptidoglycan DD-metalloendopeptidase family protein [Burkholderiales bacterium]|nr:peptidoglycan DD-metalloendopeptidase family protein [Burkholderiales bacterium]